MALNKADYVSTGNRTLITRIREHILATGRAHLADFPGLNVLDQIRLLVSIDVIERRGDELHLVDEPNLAVEAQRRLADTAQAAS